MLGITLSAIAVQVYELYIPTQSMNPKYIWLSDIVFIVATLIELVLKVLILCALSFHYTHQLFMNKYR